LTYPGFADVQRRIGWKPIQNDGLPTHYGRRTPGPTLHRDIQTANIFLSFFSPQAAEALRYFGLVNGSAE
jgi:hypothetical protein